MFIINYNPVMQCKLIDGQLIVIFIILQYYFFHVIKVGRFSYWSTLKYENPIS